MTLHLNRLAKFCLAGVFTALTAPTFAGIPSRIIGNWNHDGNTTSIRYEHRHLLVCNEQGSCAEGYSPNGHILNVPQWNVSGVIQHGGSVIAWNNGTRWTKQAAGYPAQRGIQINIGNGYPAQQGYPAVGPRYRHLSGPWMHAGRPASIHLSPDAKNFTITNEEGVTSGGYIDQNGDLVLPNDRIVGKLNHTGTHIRWSNGTTWFKR